MRDLLQLEETRADDGRDGQQEGVAGGRLAVVAEEAAHRQGGARAGDAGDEGERLREAHEESIAERELLERLVGAADAVGDAEDDAHHDEHGADDPEAAEVLLDHVLEGDADHDDGQRAQDDEPPHPGVEVAPVLRVHQRPEPHRGDPPDVLAEVEQHRQLGADLDHRGEGRARVAPAEELGEDPQVRAAGDRQELRESLEDPEDHGLEEVDHGRELYGARVGVPETPAEAVPTTLSPCSRGESVRPACPCPVWGSAR